MVARAQRQDRESGRGIGQHGRGAAWRTVAAAHYHARLAAVARHGFGHPGPVDQLEFDLLAGRGKGLFHRLTQRFAKRRGGCRRHG
nr:hypothetical protein [Novosphingobium sp. G106]